MKQSGVIPWMIFIWHGYTGKALGGRWVLGRVPAKTSPLDFHGADDPQKKVTTCWNNRSYLQVCSGRPGAFRCKYRNIFNILTSILLS